MGYKAHKFLICLLVVLLLQQPLAVKAETTAVELYNFFDIPYTLVYPDDVLSTINSYLYAQKYEHMYKYVVLSQYDESVLTNRIDFAKERLNVVVAELQHGYSLSKEDIYSLESEYSELVEYISNEESKLVSVPVECVTPTNANTPTYDAYISACNKRALVETYADIGDLSIPMSAPVVSSWLVEESIDTSITFRVASGASITSIWNGEVVSVEDDRLILSCHNEILVGYANLQTVNVEVGDTVYQGQPIGKANSTLLMKLSLNGSFVDISKLFIEE